MTGNLEGFLQCKIQRSMYDFIVKNHYYLYIFVYNYINNHVWYDLIYIKLYKASTHISQKWSINIIKGFSLSSYNCCIQIFIINIIYITLNYFKNVTVEMTTSFPYLWKTDYIVIRWSNQAQLFFLFKDIGDGEAINKGLLPLKIFKWQMISQSLISCRLFLILPPRCSFLKSISILLESKWETSWGQWLLTLALHQQKHSQYGSIL